LGDQGGAERSEGAADQGEEHREAQHEQAGAGDRGAPGAGVALGHVGPRQPGHEAQVAGTRGSTHGEAKLTVPAARLIPAATARLPPATSGVIGAVLT